MSYTHTLTVPPAWAEPGERTRKALAGQGFGILTKINIHAVKLLVTGRGKSTGCFRTRHFTLSA